MKTFLTLVATLILTHAAHASTVTCTGVYDNKGTSVTLTIEDGSYSVIGTSVDGDGFGTSVKCKGKLGEASNLHGYNQYFIKETKACPVNYLKIMPSVESQGSGMFVLSRTSGGDTHDDSGYSYRWYHCGH